MKMFTYSLSTGGARFVSLRPHSPFPLAWRPWQFGLRWSGRWAMTPGDGTWEVCVADWRAEDEAEEGARAAAWWGGEAA